jgi:hypothetical protein
VIDTADMPVKRLSFKPFVSFPIFKPSRKMVNAALAPLTISVVIVTISSTLSSGETVVTDVEMFKLSQSGCDSVNVSPALPCSALSAGSTTAMIVLTSLLIPIQKLPGPEFVIFASYVNVPCAPGSPGESRKQYGRVCCTSGEPPEARSRPVCSWPKFVPSRKTV